MMENIGVDLDNWDPMYIKETVERTAGTTISNTEWNRLWTFLITQGDYLNLTLKEMITRLVDASWFENEQAQINAINATVTQLLADSNTQLTYSIALHDSMVINLAAAQAAEVAAELAKTNAETAEADALASKNSATNSMNVAIAQATSAGAAKDAAVIAKTDAETAKSGADTAKAGADLSASDALAAKNAAVTAKLAAETVKATAIAAQAAAEGAQAAAEGARDTAVTKAGEADASATTATEQAVIATDKAAIVVTAADAETARVNAESARVTAETARADAENSRVTVEGARVVAETARADAEALRQTGYTGFDGRIDAIEVVAADIRKTYAANFKGLASADAILTITDSADASDFISVKALGKATQNGTPTPDSPVAITGVKPAKVTVQGKNYFDKTKLTRAGTYAIVTQIANGVNLSGTYYAQIAISLLKNTNYTMSWTFATVSGTPTPTWRFKYTDGSFSANVNSGVTIQTDATKTVEYIYLYVAGATTASGDFTNIQLELGSTATAYEAYSGTDYALPTLGFMYSLSNGIADTYNAVSGLETRNIGVMVFDGTGTFTNNQTLTSVVGFTRSVPNAIRTPRQCTHFTDGGITYTQDTEMVWTYSAGTNIGFNISKTRLAGYSEAWTAAEKIAAFQAWLTANPVTVYYQLATPTTTQYTPQTVPQPSLTANITVDGAGISVEYSKDIASALALKADKAQEAWITPTLLNGWVNGSYGGTVGFRKNNFNEIEFKGYVMNGTAAQTIFVLPAGCRPVISVYVPCWASSSVGTLLINSAGEVKLVTGVNTQVSLNSIKFIL